MGKTVDIAYRKNNALGELDALKGNTSYNIIAPKPSIEEVAEQSGSVGGDKASGWKLFFSAEKKEARIYWAALGISIGVILLFVLAAKKRWIKL
jgi:hypothetical protein